MAATPAGEFQSHQFGLNSPARTISTITPTNDAVLSPTPRALFIGTGGDVAIKPIGGGTAIVFKNLANGSILPVMPGTVEATNTSATDIVALS